MLPPVLFRRTSRSNPPLRFGAIPDIQRNLLMAARYGLLSDQYTSQRRKAFERGDQWGVRISNFFEREAREAKARSEGLIEAAVADPDIFNYLKGAETYNIQPLATRVTGLETIMLSEPPPIGQENTFTRTCGRITSPTQSLSRFFSRKNTLMTGRSKEDLLRSARNLVHSLGLALERQLDPKWALAVPAKPELLAPFCKSLSNGIPGFNLSVAFPDSVQTT